MKQRERTNLVFFLSSFTSFLQLLALLWKSGTVLFFSFVIYETGTSWFSFFLILRQVFSSNSVDLRFVPCVPFVTSFSFETDAKGTCLSSFQILPNSSPPVLLNSCFSSIRVSYSICVSASICVFSSIHFSPGPCLVLWYFKPWPPFHSLASLLQLHW